MNLFKKKLIMMANQVGSSSLPSHLERAEYLEATGTQYIDLGYPLGYENKVVVECLATSRTIDNYALGYAMAGKYLLLNLKNSTNISQNFDGVSNAAMLYRDYKSLYSISKEGIYCNDDFYAWKGTPVDFVTEGNVYLFARNASSISYFLGKIYACQIYNHDILIHDYIPAFNTENRRPCMYDTITGIELYNQGTGEFNYHIEGRPIPYLAFEALEDDLQVSITKSATQYSLDRVTWVDLPAEEMTPPINKGERVWFRAEITPDGTSTGIGTFSCTKQCNLEGTPMSLLYGDRTGDNLSLPNKQYCFAYLFANNDKIIRVNNPREFLPAMVLTNYYCYQSMFYGCSNLVNMCYLPALVLTNYCYASMYNRCSSLVEIFDFPEWTQMASSCCNNMFAYCISVKKQPKITTKLEKLTYTCFGAMFAYCTSMEECQEVLQFTILAQGCYNSMYRKTAIKKAPEILAVKYDGGQASQMGYMFADCSYLETPPSILYTEEVRQQMCEYMFSNCYKLKKSPILHHQSMELYSNRYMFQNCISLDYIVLLMLDSFSVQSNAWTSWVNGVAPKGTIVLNKNIEWNPEDYRGVSGIPEGWEVKYCDPDNLDDIRDYREIDKAWDADTQVVNTILESVITEEQLDNMDSLLQQISQSQEDMSSINTQLENIINT